MIHSFEIFVSPSRNMSFKNQERLARLLGINDVYTLYNGVPPVEGLTPFFFWKIESGTAYRIFSKIFEDDPLGVNEWSTFLS